MPVEFVEYDRERRLIMANQAARDASPWRVPGAARQDGRRGDGKLCRLISATADNAQAWKAWTRQTVADYPDRGGVSEILPPRRPVAALVRRSDMPGGGRVVVRVDITDEEAARGTARCRDGAAQLGVPIDRRRCRPARPRRPRVILAVNCARRLRQDRA